MSLVSAEHVEALYNNSLNIKLAEIQSQLNTLKPPVIEPFRPVVIDRNVSSWDASLDSIKSLGKFDGKPSATIFAME